LFVLPTPATGFDPRPLPHTDPLAKTASHDGTLDAISNSQLLSLHLPLPPNPKFRGLFAADAVPRSVAQPYPLWLRHPRCGGRCARPPETNQHRPPPTCSRGSCWEMTRALAAICLALVTSPPEVRSPITFPRSFLFF
jgi:hypothetical protein